jgi:putative membrane protein
MELYPKNKLPIADVKRFIIIFYIVGLIGFIIPFSKAVFSTITPLALLLNTYLLAIYHNKYTLKEALIFPLILLCGFVIEVIGVKSGLIFGTYTYGDALGLKVFDTPLMIGLNWLFLTYTATAIANSLTGNKWIAIFVAPALMLVYDVVLEQVAPRINMWSWQKPEVPLRNYIAWYVIAFCFVLLLKIIKTDTRNPLAAILFICQFVFFALLTLLL